MSTSLLPGPSREDGWGRARPGGGARRRRPPLRWPALPRAPASHACSQQVRPPSRPGGENRGRAGPRPAEPASPPGQARLPGTSAPTAPPPATPGLCRPVPGPCRMQLEGRFGATYPKPFTQRGKRRPREETRVRGGHPKPQPGWLRTVWTLQVAPRDSQPPALPGTFRTKHILTHSQDAPGQPLVKASGKAGSSGQACPGRQRLPRWPQAPPSPASVFPPVNWAYKRAEPATTCGGGARCTARPPGVLWGREEQRPRSAYVHY